MMKHNRWICLLAALFTTFAVAQEFRETAVPNKQIPAVVKDVAGWHDAQNHDCPFKKALGSTVIERHGGDSIERWVIEGCQGRAFAYKVTVLRQDQGGVTDFVSNMDDSPIGDGRAEPPTPTPEECAASQKRFDDLNAKRDITDEELGEIPQLAADLALCASP